MNLIYMNNQRTHIDLCYFAQENVLAAVLKNEKPTIVSFDHGWEFEQYFNFIKVLCEEVAGIEGFANWSYEVVI